MNADKLAQEIRRLALGAAALAEALMPFLAEHDAQPVQAAQPHWLIAPNGESYRNPLACPANSVGVPDGKANHPPAILIRDPHSHYTPQPPAQPSADAEDMARKYHELLFAVARKFPGESRHETALRYIREAESHAYEECDAARAAERGE